MHTMMENSDIVTRSDDMKKLQNLDVHTESNEETTEEQRDGGTVGWISIFGSWLVSFSTFGYFSSFGVYQDFYTRFYLSDHSASKIAWIGSFQLMMPFLLGLVSGKLFDDGYFHALVITGSALFTISLFMLSLVKPQHYAQVFLSQGVGMGVGLGLTFVPSVSSIVHHFQKRKVLATGIVMSGSSLGGIVFPIMINHLIKSIGFPKAVRASGYLVLGMLVLANCLMRSAYPKSAGSRPQLNILSFFTDPPYIFSTLGAVTSVFGFYFPQIYLQLYAVTHGIDTTLAFYSLAIVNGSSAIGRVFGNNLAQNHGPFTVLVPCTLLTAASIFSVLGVHNSGSLVVVSVFYGFFAGAWLSISVACLGTLARHPNEVGARTGLALAISSFATLGSAPIQGSLLGPEFNWNKPVIFSGIFMGITSIFQGIARYLYAKERNTQKV